jgi:CBS domain-containing protein
MYETPPTDMTDARPTMVEPPGEPGLIARLVMRAPSRTVAPGDSLARAARLMESQGTLELPVVDGGVLVGILTLTDI